MENQFSDSASKPPTSTMNKVYILIGRCHYDNDEIVGVFADSVTAEARKSSFDLWSQQRLDIEEYDLE